VFILTCQGMAQRSLGDRAASARLLERARAHPALSPYARLFVTHRLAKALEEVGRYADAEQYVAQVAAGPQEDHSRSFAYDHHCLCVISPDFDDDPGSLPEQAWEIESTSSRDDAWPGIAQHSCITGMTVNAPVDGPTDSGRRG
jgi:hypothetical protein